MKGRRGFVAALGALPLAPQAFAQTPAPPPVADPRVDALAQAIEQRYGTFLAPGDMKDIRETIEGNLKAAERLRKVKLGNADEPVTVFEAAPPPVRRR